MDREVFGEVNMTDVHLNYFCHATVAAATARTDRWVRKGKQGAAPNAAPVWMSEVVAAKHCTSCGVELKSSFQFCTSCGTPL